MGTAEPERRRTGPKLGIARRLREGRVLAGVVLKMPAPALAELAGHVGLDLIVLDTEHGPNGADLLEHHIRAADSADIPVLVRVKSNDRTEILAALDAGAAGVIVPHVNNAQEAAAAVRAAHYPPLGDRGFAMSTRAGRYGTNRPERHIGDATERTIVVVQVEDVAAIPHVSEIAATTRLDAVWVGPSDLSMSLGRPLQYSHPEVVAAIDEIEAQIKSAHNARLCVIVRKESDARRWRRRGAGIVLFGAMEAIADRFAEFASDAIADELRGGPLADGHVPAARTLPDFT
ncbi:MULTISPECIES: HpcH/HpaI aldolase/citrate lyase family protein [Actinomycetes]|uniref:HpcH/HpaI aldolase family protein n=1 Tax=Actinomycetes TaxID=1760 RepID=UPI00131A3E24|nr:MULTISPECIES: aldolase/citrate lyase family protein [Actinomycetes]